MLRGINQDEKVKGNHKRAIQSGLKTYELSDGILEQKKHRKLYANIERFLVEHGVEIMFGYTCEDNIILEENKCVGIRIKRLLLSVMKNCIAISCIKPGAC